MNLTARYRKVLKTASHETLGVRYLNEA